MKKIILALTVVGFISVAAITKANMQNENTVTKTAVNDDKYKACIEACEQAVESCKKCEAKCAKENNMKMAECAELCKECIVACNVAIESMKANSVNVHNDCMACAKACEACATECEKHDVEHCKKCSVDGCKAAKLCYDMH